MKRKGFTLIELIVVMVIISILILLGTPKYLNYTKEAHLTKIKVNIKGLEVASQKYYMSYADWPRLTDEPLTSTQLESYTERIIDITGEEPLLESDGKYYEIDYTSIEKYTQIPKDKENYILQNPVGNVVYLDNLTEEGKSNLTLNRDSNNDNNIRQPIEGEIAIKTAEELAKIGVDANYPLSGSYIQMADIDLSTYGNWKPISVFTGKYDGNGFKISNLTINRLTENNIGLFGHIGSGGKLSNVSLENSDVKGYKFVGALVGYNQGGAVEKSYSTGKVVGNNEMIGGLVGYSAYGIVSNSYSEANVHGYSHYVGGLVGCTTVGSVSDSYATGNVSSSGSGVGGVIGWCTGTATNTYSTSIVSGNGAVGGLVGYLTAGKVYYSYSNKGAGIVGDFQQGGSTTGSSKYSDATMYQQATYQGWDFDNIWVIDEGKDYPRLRWEDR